MKFKLTIYPSFEQDRTANIQSKFNTKDELNAARNACCDLLLFIQDDMKVMNDDSNMTISEEFINGLWQGIDEE